MKALVICVVVVLLTVIYTSVIIAQQVSITVDQIIANERISGRVSGLRPSDYPDYKVIVYIHTDQWYIHPYAGQDENLSWAPIKEDGTW